MKVKRLIPLLFICILSLMFSCEEDEPVIKVKSVTLSKTSLVLYVGSSEILTTTLTPSDATIKNVEWKSNNTSVATVNSNGMVVAIKVGDATITATTFDGNKTATCAITAQQKNTFTDTRDGNVYDYVTIGTQVWMAENLSYLPKVVGPEDGSITEPYYYVYNYDGNVVADAKITNEYVAYGVLYNWPAALTACPAGWHLPSDVEWATLTDYVGISTAGIFLKTIDGWNIENNGTDKYGFSAMPGGSRFFSEVYGPYGFFDSQGTYGFWWSKNESNNVFANRLLMGYHLTVTYSDDIKKDFGLSVRCLKD